MGRIDERAELLRDVYREIALCLGGILAARRGAVRGDFVWELCRSLRQLYRRHRARYAGVAPDRPVAAARGPRPHPAMVELLDELEEAR